MFFVILLDFFIELMVNIAENLYRNRKTFAFA